MKILHVVGWMEPAKGGVCQAVRNICEGLSDMGIANDIASLDSPTADFLKNETLVIHPLGPGKSPWHVNLKLLEWLIINLKEYNVVIVHGLWMFHSFAVTSALRKIKRRSLQKRFSLTTKVFVMPHGMLDPYFQKAKNRKFKAVRNNIFWKMIESKTVNELDGLFFTTNEELKLASQSFKSYHPAMQAVVGLGVKSPPRYSDSMSHSTLQPAIPTEYLLFLGRIDRKKGLEILLLAYRRFLEDTVNIRCGDLNLNCKEHLAGQINLDNIPALVIAGPGLDSNFGSRIHEHVINDELLSNKVHFRGMVAGDEKWKLFYECQAFVLSSHQENFGISVVEAMACGKPVLISNKINIHQDVSDMNAGLICDDNAEALFLLLKKWSCLNAAEIKSMSYSAKSCFENKFTIKAATRLLHQVLNAAFQESSD